MEEDALGDIATPKAMMNFGGSDADRDDEGDEGAVTVR